MDKNRVGGRGYRPPLTPPDMRVRIRRFSSVRTCPLAFVSSLYNEWLGPLARSHRLHLFRRPSSFPIFQEIRLSSLILLSFHSRLTSRSALPSGLRSKLVVWPMLTPAISWPLDQGYSSCSPTQVSPGKNIDFPCILLGFTILALDCIGLRCLLANSSDLIASTQFVFLKSQVCLRLPPTPPHGDALAFR